MSRPVITPLGRFVSAAAAARRHRVTRQCMDYRLHHASGYGYDDAAPAQAIPLKAGWNAGWKRVSDVCPRCHRDAVWFRREPLEPRRSVERYRCSACRREWCES